MYSVSPELYHQTMLRLTEAIGARDYYSDTLVFRFEELECRLRASVIVYRQRVVQPEGILYPISDLVPVWWEFHTHSGPDEVANDFSFSQIRQLF